MSQYAINRACDKCKKIEKSLVEINIGVHRIMLCYDCMLEFCKDMEQFKQMNYNA